MDMDDKPVNEELPAAINIRRHRAIYLAIQLRFNDEPLTNTVERHLERAYLEMRLQQARPKQPKD